MVQEHANAVPTNSFKLGTAKCSYSEIGPEQLAYGYFVNLLRRFKKSTIWRAIRVLDRRDRFLIGAVSIVQVGLSFLDLLGVAAIGMLGALSVSGIQSGTPGNRVSSALRLLHIDGFTFQHQIAILGVIATTLLVGRTLISIFFSRRSLYFLSRRGAIISTKLISKLLFRVTYKI